MKGARFVCWLLFFVIILWSSVVYCGDGFQWADQVVEVRLSNGMKWLILERSDVRTFAGFIGVKVGVVDEPDGKTGLSHMLEHMAFKGTKKIGTRNYKKEEAILYRIAEVGRQLTKERLSAEADTAEIKRLEEELSKLQKEHRRYVFPELDMIMERNGAIVFNATTGYDSTEYYAEMPSEALELWLYVMSEVLTRPVMREFYLERDVVLEERRQRIDSNPWGRVYEALNKAAFRVSPYGRMAIGTHREIKSYLVEDVEELHRKFYVPANMIGAIVGRIDAEEARKLITRYFGSIPPGKVFSSSEPKEPLQKHQRRVVVHFDANPRLAVAYRKPSMPSWEDYVFDVIYYILCDGRTSRLYRRLVQRDKIAVSIGCSSAYPASRLDDNLMLIVAVPMLGVDMRRLEMAIDDEVSRLSSEKVSMSELRKALNKNLSSWYFSFNSNLAMAKVLVKYEQLAGSWRYIIKHQEMLEKIAPSDILQVTKRFMVPSNKTVVWQVRYEKK